MTTKKLTIYLEEKDKSVNRTIINKIADLIEEGYTSGINWDLEEEEIEETKTKN